MRRAWLWGFDEYADRDYSHRKQWVLERLSELAGAAGQRARFIPASSTRNQRPELGPPRGEAGCARDVQR